jgi:ABC-type branched-subunit amino acid transport system substrate-binding protein
LFTLKSAFNPVNLGKNGRYLGKMIAVGWGVPEAKNPDFIQMTKYLNLSTSTTVVNETLALGYDAADLICNLTAEFKKQKQKSLEQNFTFKGAYYSFNFLSGNRSNQQVDFFRYDGKGFIPIQAPASFKSR